MIDEAVSTCKVRKYSAESKVFLVILLLNDVALQKTLVEKGLAAKIGGAPASAPRATPSAAPSRATADNAAAAPTPTSAPPAAAVAASPVVAPVEVTSIAPSPTVAVPESASRSVAVIAKNNPSPSAITSPLSMIPRSVVRSPTPPASTILPAGPEKKIVVDYLQVGAESNNVVMNVASAKDIALLMQPSSDLPNYAGMEEVILGATQELMTKRGIFEDQKRQLQRGAAVLALFEGQVKLLKFLSLILRDRSLLKIVRRGGTKLIL